jgi:hypothetical protein
MRTTGLGWVVALAIAMSACGRNHAGSEQADANRTGQPAAAAASTDAAAPAPNASRAPAKTEGARSPARHPAAKAEHRAPVTLTGCLQKGSGGGDYLLTDLRGARATTGTSGKSAGGQSDSDPIAYEQIHAASRTYHLSGHRRALAPLVGKEVRVKGTLANADRARVDVASVDSVSSTCGGKSPRSR